MVKPTLSGKGESHVYGVSLTEALFCRLQQYLRYALVLCARVSLIHGENL